MRGLNFLLGSPLARRWGGNRPPPRALYHLVLATMMLSFLAAAAHSAPAKKKNAKKTSSPKVGKSAPAKPGYVEEGMASWYGKRFHGRKTANGERFNMNALTAAHRTLPFGTMVKVTNLGNKKTVTVRINDRGPWVKNRIIDLSYAAAKQIGMIEKGCVKVRIETVSKNKAPTPESKAEKTEGQPARPPEETEKDNPNPPSPEPARDHGKPRP